MDINTVALSGRIVADAQVKYTQSGNVICKFSIANGYRTKKNGEWTDATNFIDVTWFAKTAEKLAQYMTKGKSIAITGELRQDTWEQDGQRRSKIGVVASNVQLLGGSKQDAGNQSSQQASQTVNPHDSGFDDSIPF